MKLIVKIVSVFCIMLMVPVNQLPGALTDFDKSVKREQAKNKASDKGGNRHDSSGMNQGESSDDSFLTELLMIVFIMNSLVEGYTSYPYSDGDYSNFVALKKDAGQGSGSPGVQVVIPVPPRETRRTTGFFLAFDMGGQYAHTNGAGCFVSVTGKFWIYFGPEFEYRRLWDGDDFLDIYAAGLNIPLVQTSGFTLEFFGEGAWMRGVTRLNGYIVGGTIRSIPIRPLVLQVRYGYHVYDYIEFSDLEGRIGLMLWRMEFFGGYRYMKAGYAQIDGPIFGVRIWI